MPAGNHDHIRCFADQVKLTRASVRDLDEAIKEVNLLEEHEEESSQNITEVEALCKWLREDTQRLREENTALEEMIQSHDELILEMAEEYGLNHMGENDDNEDEDDDDEGNVVAPPAPAPAAVAEEIVEEEDPVERLDDLNDLGDLDGDSNEGRSDVEERFPKMGVMIEIESPSLSL
jgi:hypothetical protein